VRHKDPGEVTRLLGIGRFVEKKGWIYAIEAVAAVIKSGLNVQYTIVGNGELRGDVEKKIAEFGIQDSVTLLGWCDHEEIARLLEESHVFLAPSVTARDGDQEGIPNVLKEAMAVGLPVIGTLRSGIPVSRSLRDKLLANGCPAEKIRVLHSGIDCSRFRYSERRREPDGVTRLVGIGRFVEKKGWGYAIEAVARLIASGRIVHYTIVGEGALRSDVEQKIAECGIQDSVTLLGWCEQEEITRLLERSHILLAPSVTAKDGDQEGIPNVLKEAMAMGLPVISTWHSGIPELVEDGITGYLVPERDVDALTDRLIYVCEHPESWAKMGEKAKAKIEADFDTERINNTLEQMYIGLTGLNS
jgi:glycosyltransferase involved in cell wall biosynthesis